MSYKEEIRDKLPEACGTSLKNEVPNKDGRQLENGKKSFRDISSFS